MPNRPNRRLYWKKSEHETVQIKCHNWRFNKGSQYYPTTPIFAVVYDESIDEMDNLWAEKDADIDKTGVAMSYEFVIYDADEEVAYTMNLIPLNRSYRYAYHYGYYFFEVQQFTSDPFGFEVNIGG